MAPNGTTWFTQTDSTTVQNAVEQTLALSQEPGTYQWRIECLDPDGEIASSALQTYTIDIAREDTEVLPTLAATTQEQTYATDELTLQIEDKVAVFMEALSRLENADARTQEAAAAMQLDKTIKNAVKAIERAKRDHYDVKYRRDMTDQDKQAYKRELEATIERVYEETPRELRVSKTQKFITYPEKDELPQHLTELSRALGEETINEAVIDRLQELQQGFTFSTMMYNVEFGMTDGSFKTATIIRHQFTYDNTSNDAEIYLKIPTGVTNEPDSIQTLDTMDLIRGEPYINIGKPQAFSYYVLGPSTHRRWRRSLLCSTRKSSQPNAAPSQDSPSLTGLASAEHRDCSHSSSSLSSPSHSRCTTEQTSS
ncbi:MAG: hypothetical protein HC945_03210 [Nitrosarchaeum sp.]|nr:hypothetical protein [Nitrosarchaeum sp.]